MELSARYTTPDRTAKTVGTAATVEKAHWDSSKREKQATAKYFLQLPSLFKSRLIP